MGKGRKRKRKVDELGSGVDVVPPLQSNIHELAQHTKDKKKKKIEKKFAKALLQRADADGWEGHELARLAFLVSESLDMKKQKFIKFLVKSDVLSSLMIAGMQDLGFDFGDASLILTILYEKSESNHKFINTYKSALDNALFSVRDLQMILKLSDIVQKSQFSREHIVKLLHATCSHAETLRICGQLLHSFCMDMMEEQAAYYITEVLKFDFVLELFGLLEDFLDELGDLRSVVEKRVRAMLKVNRLGEIVDSDADDNGNLKGFVVSDDESPVRAAKKKYIMRRKGIFLEDGDLEDDLLDDDEMKSEDEDAADDDNSVSYTSDVEVADVDTHVHRKVWSPDSSISNPDDSCTYYDPQRNECTRSYDSSNDSEDSKIAARSSSQSKRRRVVAVDSDSDDSDEDDSYSD